MKNIFSILIPFVALSLLASCQQELVQPDNALDKVILKDPVPGDMAEVTFTVTVPKAGVSTLSTKALTEQPNIGVGDIYLALFGLGNNNTQGRGGNLQHFIKAKLIDGNPITHDLTEGSTTYRYRYAVLLPISEEPFVVDFMVGASDPDGNLYTLDNPPTVQYEADFMPGMLSRNGEPGYWQRIVIPKVVAATNANGYVPSSEYNPDNYTVDMEVEGMEVLQDIQLVRNFAMVTFTAPETAKFTINRFFLVDYPKYGDIAPFDAASTVGYKTPYMGHNTDYASIVSDTYKYLGYSTNKTLQDGIPDPLTDDSYTASGSFSFLYERPAPSDEMPESGAIIEVTWKDVDGVDADLKDGEPRYYKVVFTGESGYLPILRNIVYNFQISDFSTPTHHTTAASAYAGTWLGDISANVATANLDEIANSTSKIIVSEMSKTHIGDPTTTPYSIYFQYYPDTQNHSTEVAVVNNTTTSWGKKVKVVASVEAVSGYDAAIRSITQPVADTGYASGATWGRVDVQTYGSGSKVLRSKLKILCQMEGHTALYREVIFTVMEKQRFNNGLIDSSIDVVEDAIGKQTILHLRIPSDLPKDLFPLQVRIESQANNLTSIPVGDVEALPVKYGLSAFNNTKSTYYFVKTINWDDYAHLSGETYSYTTEFPCYFKTTLDSGNTTKISLQDLTATNSTQVNAGKYFYEMQLDLLSEGISVSPSAQLINHDVTSATVTVAASSTWTLGAHDGLTVASGPTSGDPGSYEITFTFPVNDSQEHKSYTATFTMGSLSATATIEQTALVAVPFTRTISTNSSTFNSSYVYTGDYASEVGISFTNGNDRRTGHLRLGRPSTVTITASDHLITSVVFTWTDTYNYVPTTTTVVNGGGTATTNSNTTTWTNTSGAESVGITFNRNNNTLRVQTMAITYLVYEEQ